MLVKLAVSFLVVGFHSVTGSLATDADKFSVYFLVIGFQSVTGSLARDDGKTRGIFSCN